MSLFQNSRTRELSIISREDRQSINCCQSILCSGFSIGTGSHGTWWPEIDSYPVTQWPGQNYLWRLQFIVMTSRRQACTRTLKTIWRICHVHEDKPNTRIHLPVFIGWC